jgi:carbonic anhydrase
MTPDPTSPGPRVAVVACMDHRLDPVEALGLADGEAQVIRNAGGVVTDDVIRSLAISQHVLGTEEIVLVHHTDCGMQKITDEGFAGRLQEATGQQPEWTARAFEDLEEDLRASRRAIVDSPFVPHTDAIRSCVYEVETGRIREIA